MRRTRCFVELPLAVGALLALPDAVANHLLRVLRLADGAAVTLFNGDGCDYSGTLRIVGRGAASVLLEHCTELQNESPLRLVLAQGIARGERMDLILQKATELGVSEIWPMHCERSEVRLEGERLERRLQHWRGVLASAAEQSGRAVVPRLVAPCALPRIAADLPPDCLRLTLAPTAELGLSSLAVAERACVVFAIGPEGGLSPAEIGQLTEAGFSALRLGPRILRTETAGLAALAAFQSRFGDLG